jgi:hypothetical protein
MLQRNHARSSTRVPDKGYPVSVLPKHFFGQLRSRTSGLGERRLAVAVFEDAVHCLEKCRKAADLESRTLYVEAEQWIESKEREHVFSFESVCSILGLRPHSIRERFHLWREGRLRESDGIPAGILEKQGDAAALGSLRQASQMTHSAAQN